LNATGAAALASKYGVSADEIGRALKTFKSVKRRLEVKAEIGGITIIDDFAHHPTAIRETLQALRTRYPGRKLWAIFEPRSNTLRRKIFQHELVESLRVADEVVMASVFKAEGIPADERLESSAVIQGLIAVNLPAREIKDADAIVATVSPELKPGDV